MTTDPAMQHAKEYHDQVYAASVDMPAPEYIVWSWDEMPEANRRMLAEASRRFMGGSSAEQLAIALMSEARSHYGAAGNGSLEQQRRKRELADRLAQWASDIRQLGLDQARLRDSWAQQMQEKDAKLKRVRGAMEDWQRCIAVHQLAHKIMAVLDD